MLDPKEYAAMKQSLRSGAKIKGARALERADLDMIELFDPDVDALAYLVTKTMGERAGIKDAGPLPGVEGLLP